jgi:hypothetical protein
VFLNPESKTIQESRCLKRRMLISPATSGKNSNTARQFAEMHPDTYGVNVTGMEAVQPKEPERL